MAHRRGPRGLTGCQGGGPFAVPTKEVGQRAWPSGRDEIHPGGGQFAPECLADPPSALGQIGEVNLATLGVSGGHQPVQGVSLIGRHLPPTVPVEPLRPWLAQQRCDRRRGAPRAEVGERTVGEGPSLRRPRQGQPRYVFAGQQHGDRTRPHCAVDKSREHMGMAAKLRFKPFVRPLEPLRIGLVDRDHEPKRRGAVGVDPAGQRLDPVGQRSEDQPIQLGTGIGVVARTADE
jgi:hypothetical protein